MPRPLGPHRTGDLAHDTLTSASARLVTEVGDAIDPRALELMVDDALAPEVMTGERVDTLMLTSHTFGIDERLLGVSPTSTGRPGLLAFTERRMIAAHSYGIVRLRRFVEAFHLDGAPRFRVETPTVDGRPARLYEVGNGQGWHRIFLPSPLDLPIALVAAWDHRIASRLVGATMPRWDGNELVGWETGNATVPTRRPPNVDEIPDETGADASDEDDELDPSGPLPRTDLSPSVHWWKR